MNEANNTSDVLVLGAGICGLMAASTLEQGGLRVAVLDKGSSVGGRLATRRVGPGLADHGAQFFSVRDAGFQRRVERWLEEKLAFVWTRGFSDGRERDAGEDGYPRYAVYGGLNALARHLARDLADVRTGVRIVTATGDSRGWVLQDEDGTLYMSRGLIMTPPVPQSLRILDEGAAVLAGEDQAVLDEIRYAPCLAGLFWVDGQVSLPEPGAIQRPDARFRWIADNRRKGISPEATVITMHAHHSYSEEMWSSSDETILEAMRAELEQYLSSLGIIREAQLKRWRYSLPRTTYSERYLLADHDPLLVFAGDAFGGPRVEGAALSGLAAGEAVLNRLA
jgi:renalase